jgi:hypothetical protein
MTYAELQFDLAEAAFKGYIPGGNAAAETYYKAGIWASYEQYSPEIEDMSIGYGYAPDNWTWDSLANDFYVTDVWAWDAANAMELIATQKWVALFGQGLESWFEYRRLDYPQLVAAEDGVIDIVPVRLSYPTDEQARNSANRQAAMTNQGLDGIQNNEMQVRVWWDVN